VHLVTYLAGRSPCLSAVWRDVALDSSRPMGPALVTVDEAPDPQALGIRLRVNGETRQEASTAEMIFGVAALLASLSAGMRLGSGDVPATGTPAGVGAASGRHLEPGVVVEAEIDGLGTLQNPVVAPGAA